MSGSGNVIRFLICLVAFSVSDNNSFAANFIVKNGKGNAEIIISENPTRMQKFAAEEFQHYAKKLTGAELPIISEKGEAPVKIYIGKSKYTDQMGLDDKDLDYGAYRMIAGDDFLVLFGNDANYFIDTPNDAPPEYASTRSERKSAAEAWREKHGDMWADPFTSLFKGYNKELGVWRGDRHGSLNAVNEFLRSLGVRWYMPGDFGEYLPEIKSIALPGKSNKTVRPEWSQRAFAFHGCNPFQTNAEEMKWQLRLGLYYDPRVAGGHGTDTLLKTETVKKECPEFFALYGDTRNTGKPCYSSKGLEESAIGYASLLFDEYGVDVVSFLPTDGFMSICQCDLCKGKDTPERGFNGMMSDYVWSFMNRVAEKISKKHPDKKILNYGYNAYRDAPLKIEKFSPNLEVGLCQGRGSFNDTEYKKKTLARREALISKAYNNKIRLWEYYASWQPLPKYMPTIISEDLKRLKGHILGTMAECSRTNANKLDGKPDPKLATNHVNVWLTSRLWWNPDLDVKAMMEEYYKNFYGPAAAEMKAFIEHCENTYHLMRIEHEPIEKAFELMDLARKAAGDDDNIYARRVKMVAEYIEPLKGIMEKLKIGRSQNPVVLFKEFKKPEITLDGKLDDARWRELDSHSLKPMNADMVVNNTTWFKVFYSDGSIYFGIRCEEPEMDKIVAPANRNGDNSIFDGDSVEILLESPAVSYYQIAFDPKGNMNDIKRSGAALGKKGKIETKWESGVKSAAYKGKNYWSVEVEVALLEANQEEILPFIGVAGDKPTAKKPWYFNICRIRRHEKMEAATFSPTETGGFHNIMKFGKLAPK